MDAKTVHNIICINIAEYSDAYTWIKPRLNDRNGILDMVDWMVHFSVNIADQVLGGQATVNSDKLFYRSERQMSFEAFVAKFTNAINEKERYGSTMSDPDIVDTFWGKFQCSRIDHYKSALQVQQSLNPHTWKNILDTLSAQVFKLSGSQPIRNISEVSQSDRYTRNGHFLDSGVCTSKGSIFVGGYPDNKWRSNSVKPYWEKICNSRGNDGNHVSRKKKYTREKIKRERHKLAKIKS